MSVSYAVEVVLNIPHNKENVLRILEKGKALGVIFFKKSDDIASYDSYEAFSHLSPDQATDIFFAVDYDEMVGRLLSAKVEGVNFLIRIETRAKDTLHFSLEGIGLSGERRFFASGHSAYYVNFDRYIRFLLKWCSDFPMQHFNTLKY